LDDKVLISENQSYITGVLRKDFFKKTPLLLRVVIIYIPVLILNAYFLISNFWHICSDIGMVIGLLFAIIWMCWGPVLIYKYEVKVYPKFWLELINVCSESDKEEVIKLNKIGFMPFFKSHRPADTPEGPPPTIKTFIIYMLTFFSA
jgi:hypothetical protein